MKTSNTFEQLLRLPKVIEMTGLRKSSIYELIKRGEFPAPIPLTSYARAWKRSAVLEFVNRRINTPLPLRQRVNRPHPRAA